VRSNLKETTVNLCQELTRDHDRLRAAFDALRAAPDPIDVRRGFAGELRLHAHREDELLFVELEPALSATGGPIAAMRAEHEAIEAALDQLESPAESDWNRGLAELEALVGEHFVKEEQVLFAFAERLLDPSRLATLGALFREGSRPGRIAPEVRIADLARECPATIRVFQHHQIDFCCGGKRPLAAACATAGIDYATLADELEAAIAGAGEAADDWSERTTVDLVGHVLSRFHAGLRDELARLEAMARRAGERHGEANPELLEIANLTAGLRREMVGHLDFEERELFPRILGGDLERAAAMVEAAESEHDAVGNLLSRLRAASGGFAPPAHACNTWRGLFHGLAELERETHLHVHVENNVLFPRLATAA
jgi:regulator of cell morphogenesis and NO signaling